MRARILAAALLGVSSWTRVEAQQARSSLEACLEAALAQKPGDILKMEIEIAGPSTEAGQPAKGTRLLEIETRGAEGDEWELTCDEKSGKIIETEREVKDPNDPAFKAKAKVTEQEARKTVLAAHAGEIVEVEYEIESSGAASYEFDVKDKAGKREVKMEVDAISGTMVEHRDELYQIGIEASAENGE
jgi:uncharacterized membrane protein YkoI